jgi:thiamine kinase-like enzyme
MTDESRIIRRDIQDYFSELRNRCIIYLQNKPGFSRFQDVNSIFYALGQDQHGLVPLFLSHGDLQQGNIWLTSSDEIIIIDWETAKERSPYYDYATLHHSLRMEHSKQKIYDNILIDEGVKDRFGICNSLFARIILAEELEYRVEDVISLPGSEGLDGFNDVLNQLLLMQY